MTGPPTASPAPADEGGSQARTIRVARALVVIAFIPTFGPSALAFVAQMLGRRSWDDWGYDACCGGGFLSLGLNMAALALLIVATRKKGGSGRGRKMATATIAVAGSGVVVSIVLILGAAFGIVFGSRMDLH